MFKQLLTAIGVFVVAIVLFFVMQVITPHKNAPRIAPPSASPSDHASFPTLRVGSATFKVEVADTPQKQIQGLSGRRALPRDRGMLFVFSSPGRYDFWMKDMRFPLDLIWIHNGRVVGITENALPEGSRPATIYSPPEPVDRVLEVNAGVARELGMKTGDEVFVQ